ncbi:hypothetical protein RHGRI_034988 [Rhododendron griersonianum]|uniref:Terpene synthase metal-binding domain-containing protein n=1 Tax=Rhododendron griersonianum TaxID=479676 RepID=A0AAV6I698_9ERIC|nr:hypothetical protein RHGRI_034988 [Rhododendron griersonianum]
MTVYPSTPLPGSNPTQPLLELADVEAVLPPNVVVRWDEMLCEELVPALDKFYSPFKDFLAMMVREEEVVIRDSISSIFVDWLVDFKVCDLVLGGSSAVEDDACAIRAQQQGLVLRLKDMVRVYLIEAKWYHQGYVPSMEEYMPVAGLSGALRSLAIVSFVGMGELATN